MIQNIDIAGFPCCISIVEDAIANAFLIYPELVPFSSEWIERMATLHKVNMMVVYIPADKWNDTLTPWPEPGEAKGFPPFAGKAPQFLKILQEDIVPELEQKNGKPNILPRDLIGVSLSGLFTLWQWMLCATFRNIACLSGSFWYDGFLKWFESQSIPSKTGKAFFLLGVDEPKAHVKAYQSVGVNTEAIVERLKTAGIPVTFDWVPGNHFSRPVHRAEKALESLYS